MRNQGTKCLGETLLAAAMRGRREESSCPIRGRGRLPHEIANRLFHCFFPRASQRTDLCTVHCLCAYSFDDECTGSDRDGGSPQSRLIPLAAFCLLAPCKSRNTNKRHDTDRRFIFGRVPTILSPFSGGNFVKSSRNRRLPPESYPTMRTPEAESFSSAVTVPRLQTLKSSEQICGRVSV